MHGLAYAQPDAEIVLSAAAVITGARLLKKTTTSRLQ